MTDDIKKSIAKTGLRDYLDDENNVADAGYDDKRRSYSNGYAKPGRQAVSRPSPAPYAAKAKVDVVRNLDKKTSTCTIDQRTLRVVCDDIAYMGTRDLRSQYGLVLSLRDQSALAEALRPIVATMLKHRTDDNLFTVIVEDN